MLISLVLNVGLFHKWELGEITTSISARIQTSPSSFSSDVILTARAFVASVNILVLVLVLTLVLISNKRVNQP